MILQILIMRFFIFLNLIFSCLSSGQDVRKCEHDVQLGTLKNVSGFSANSAVGVFYGLDDKDSIKYIIITDIKEMNKIIFVHSFGKNVKKTTTLNIQIDKEMTPQKLAEYDILLFKNSKITRFSMADKISLVRFSELLHKSKNAEDLIKSLNPSNPAD